VEIDNPDLRARLEEITELYINEGVGRQIEAIAELSKLYPHSICIIGEAVAGEPKTFRFTCFQYAFDLVGSKRIDKVARTYSEVYPSSEFVQSLFVRIVAG
jgi:hypothetical protein